MPNLSALSSATTAVTALSNLVLVSPQDTIGYQPQNIPEADGSFSTAIQPPAFIFDYEGEQSVVLESDITDHYTEDNIPIQDNIALRPEIINTEGFISELNDVAPFGLQTLQAAANKLTTISGYVPQLTITAQIAYNEAFFAYQVVAAAANAAVAAVESLTGLGQESVIDNGSIVPGASQSNQQTAFQTFYGYWAEKRLFTVQTPWAVFTNCALMRVQPIQDATTNQITTFKLSFKVIRTASVAVNEEQTSYSGRASSQASPAASLGTAVPNESIGLSQGLAAQTAVA